MRLNPDSANSVSTFRSVSGAELPSSKQSDGTLRVGPILEPGAHLARDLAGIVLPSMSFAASLDPAESDLARHSPAALTSWFGEDAVRDAGGPSGPTPKVPVWTWLILVAVLAFSLEGVLLRK